MRLRFIKTQAGWIVTDNGVRKVFETAYDAWLYILLMKEIRPHRTYMPKTLYPVMSLDPFAQILGVKRYVSQNR